MTKNAIYLFDYIHCFRNILILLIKSLVFSKKNGVTIRSETCERGILKIELGNKK